MEIMKIMKMMKMKKKTINEQKQHGPDVTNHEKTTMT